MPDNSLHGWHVCADLAEITFRLERSGFGLKCKEIEARPVPTF
jgi:hypothetical protein